MCKSAADCNFNVTVDQSNHKMSLLKGRNFIMANGHVVQAVWSGFLSNECVPVILTYRKNLMRHIYNEYIVSVTVMQNYRIVHVINVIVVSSVCLDISPEWPQVWFVVIMQLFSFFSCWAGYSMFRSYPTWPKRGKIPWVCVNITKLWSMAILPHVLNWKNVPDSKLSDGRHDAIIHTMMPCH